MHRQAAGGGPTCKPITRLSFEFSLPSFLKFLKFSLPDSFDYLRLTHHSTGPGPTGTGDGVLRAEGVMLFVVVGARGEKKPVQKTTKKNAQRPRE